MSDPLVELQVRCVATESVPIDEGEVELVACGVEDDVGFDVRAVGKEDTFPLEFGDARLDVDKSLA